MKKVSLLLVFTLSVFIFGCQKEHQVKPSVNTESAKNIQQNERNIPATNWDKLPENLKNATAQKVEGNTESGRITASYIRPIGPWGGPGGTPFSIYPLGAYDKIYAIGVNAGAYVEGLVVWYITPAGGIYYYAVGNTSAVSVHYFYSNEYIYALGGRSGTYLDRLSIYSTAGGINYVFTYGGTGGTAFYQAVGFGEQVLGFLGGAGAYIDRIGGYVYSF